MAVFSRGLGRRSPIRIAAVTLGIAWLVALGGFTFAAATVTPSTPAILAAAAGLLIAGAGILYAWRDPGR